MKTQKTGFITLSPLAVNFEDRWWPMQTIWIQMKPHKMWGFVWDPNCLTFRLYISKIFGRKHCFFASFERNKYLKKLPSMQRDKQHVAQVSLLWLELKETHEVQILHLLYTIILRITLIWQKQGKFWETDGSCLPICLGAG